MVGKPPARVVPVSGSRYPGTHCGLSKALVERDEAAAEQRREREVLGVVRLRPTESVGEPPGLGPKPAVSPRLDERALQASQGRLPLGLR